MKTLYTARRLEEADGTDPLQPAFRYCLILALLFSFILAAGCGPSSDRSDAAIGESGGVVRIKWTKTDEKLLREWRDAINASDLETIGEFVENGAPLDWRCQPNAICKPLSIAADLSKVEIMRLLMDAGADPSGPNSYNDTPLIYAFRSRNPKNFSMKHPDSREAVRLLLERGADFNKPNCFGLTPFMIFSGSGDMEFVTGALERGALVNLTFDAPCEKESLRRTALILAAGAGHADVVSILLKKGADASIEDSKGKTALDYAREKGHGEVVVLLSKSEH